VFLVSHDRTFLDNVVTSTIAYEGDGNWREYEGSVQDWLIQSKRARDIAQQRAATSPAAAPATAAVPASGSKTSGSETSTGSVPAALVAAAPRKKLSYKEQRELDALPTQIASLEDEQKRITDVLEQDGGAIYAAEASRAIELGERHAQLDTELMVALERWEMLGASA